MSNSKLLNRQLNWSEHILTELRLVICTCGQCGCTIIVDPDEEEVECYACGFTSEHCDFPDLFY
jgi:hypothetical protein